MARDVLYMREANAELTDVKDAEGIVIAMRKPYATPHDWFWQLVSAGRLERYEVVCEGRAVAWIYCVGRVFQFPFMKRGDIHIGPAYTEVAFRSRGFYQALMVCALQKHQGRACWMIVEEDNFPSLHAVERVGFRRVAYLKQNKMTKVFKIQNRL